MAGGLNPNTLAFTLFAADGPDRLGEIDAYESFELIARFNEVSTWQLTALSATPGAQLLLSAANPRVVIATAPDIVFRSGPVVRVERDVGSDGDLATFTGVDDLIWLRYRLAHPEPGTPAPPYSTSATKAYSGSAAEVLADLVDDNAGPGAVTARRVPGLTVPTPAVLGVTSNVSARYQNLLTMVQRVAARARLGVEIRDLEFTVFDPADSGAVFSPDLGTLAGWMQAHEAPPANYVYIGGAGSGTARVIAEYDDAASVAAWGRIEGFEDHRDTTDPDELDQAGAEALANIPDPELQLTPLDTPSQQFLTHWALGDRVTVAYDGVVVHNVIREVAVALEANTPPRVIPTIGGRP